MQLLAQLILEVVMDLHKYPLKHFYRILIILLLVTVEWKLTTL